jgi:hypothetical protein
MFLLGKPASRKLVMHLEKCKKGVAASGRWQGHVRREEGHDFNNPDIDFRRTPLNYSLKGCGASVWEAIQALVGGRRDAGKALRKDAVYMCGVIVSAGKGFFDDAGEAEQRAFFAESLRFFEGKYGAKNVVEAVVHMDEATPHMHLALVPMTSDNRLCARDMFSPGPRGKLAALHNEFHKKVGLLHGLERGEPGSSAVHVTENQYKVNKMKAELEAGNRELELIAGQVAAMRSELVRIGGSIESGMDELARLGAERDERLGGLERLGARLSELAGGVAEREVWIREADGYLAAVRAEWERLGSEVGLRKAELVELGGQADGCRAAVAQYEGELVGLARRLDAEMERFREASRASAAESGRMRGLRDEVARMEKLASSLESSVASLEKRHGEYSGAVAKLRVEYGVDKSVAKRIAALDSEVAKTAFGGKVKLDHGDYRNLVKLAMRARAFDEVEASLASEALRLEQTRVEALRMDIGEAVRQGRLERIARAFNLLDESARERLLDALDEREHPGVARPGRDAGDDARVAGRRRQLPELE